MTYDSIIEIMLHALRLYADGTIDNSNPAAAEYALLAWEDYNNLDKMEVEDAASLAI